MSLTRWTPLVFMAPGKYLDTEYDWRSFDLESWSNYFTYEPDGWNGLNDTTDPPRRTIRREKGDCDDYALVAASWLLGNNHSAKLVYCYKPWPFQAHLIAVGNGKTYSTGQIRTQTPAEFLEKSRYTRSLTRRLTI